MSPHFPNTPSRICRRKSAGPSPDAEGSVAPASPQHRPSPASRVQAIAIGDHFVIENITVHRTPSSNLVEKLETVGLPLEIRSTIAGNSRK